MASTRLRNDPIQMQKQLQESTYLGRYQINRPGQGIHMPFLEDPNIRLQHWGANLQTNTVDLESEFRNLGRTLNRDSVQENHYKQGQLTASRSSVPLLGGYTTQSTYVEESRASHPAWTYKGKAFERWEMPWINPQAITHLETSFPTEVSTRLLEKDNFTPVLPPPPYQQLP